MTKFFYKLKKPCFGQVLVHFPNIGIKFFFSLENLVLSPTTSDRFLESCQNIGKNLMMQFQENTRTDKRTERQMEGKKDRRIDRPYSTEPSRLLPGVQKTFLQ